MTESERSAVSEAIWPWKERQVAAPGAKEKPPAGRVVCEVAVMATVGLMLRLVFKKPVMSTVVFVLATLVLAGGLWLPPLYRGFRKLGHALAKGVGIALSWILLVPFFYVCFPIGRLILVVLRKDPMHRNFLPKDQTYWSEHRPLPEADAYRRQY